MSDQVENMEQDQVDDETMEDDEESQDEIPEEEKEVYLPTKPIGEDEELVCDESAYVMLHSGSTGAPCLSFDVVPDNLGNSRETFPLTAYMVSGTQAAGSYTNQVIVMKMANLHRTSKEKEKKDSDLESDEESSSDEEEEDEEKKPVMSAALIKHIGSVNRIRQTRLNNKNLVATWSENSKVYVYDISAQLQAVDDPQALKTYNDTKQCDLTKPIYTFRGHTTEGYGLDWCSTEPGVLATGDCQKNIHIWKPTEDGTWVVNQVPLLGHTKSVEDIQWSPNERNVLATCSVDKSIRIFDTRAAPQAACMLTCENAHESDVNVISWNKTDPFLVSGGDDGVLHVWDLRQFQTKVPIATFKHHTQAVTSVEWYPNESTIFASGGADDQIALWDLAVEKDDSQKNDDAALNNLPPQLLFIHQGQKEIKELHWHPQMPGVLMSTAHNGFNVFRTISV